MPVDFAAMNQFLYEGQAKQVKALTEQALSEGHSAEDVLEKGLIFGMSVVGEDFKHNRVYVPEVLIAARAMKVGMKVLKPLLTAGGVPRSAGTLVMGTVKGDLHDIGKNLVIMMSEGAGFTVVDLGVDVRVETYLQAVKEHQADILGMSALLTTTMPYMKVVIDAFRDAGQEHLKICVGGAPINETYADEIGADGYARDAASAVELFTSLMAESRARQEPAPVMTARGVSVIEREVGKMA